MAGRTRNGAASGTGRPAAVANRYGHFSDDGREFVVTDPHPPRPWVNVIANPRFGLVVSHTGSGFSWIDNSQLAVLTRWQQELAHDSSGRFLYARDASSGELWSLSPAPTWPAYERYACRHGLGYTAFETLCNGIEARWTLFCPVADAVELWLVELHNTGRRERRIELCGFVEWCMGIAPSPRREFQKLFIETWHDDGARAVLARSHMWDVSSQSWGHWNTSFPFVAAFACSEALTGAQGDKAEFFGRGGDSRAPRALGETRWRPAFGRHEDPIAALRCTVSLPAGESRRLGFALAAGGSPEEALGTIAKWCCVDAIDAGLAETHASWLERLAAHRIETPERSLDALVNDWVRYQAISARLWGRCGYYQQSGAFGFRDQLQDSQVWLTIAPERCREQVRLHAAHQFVNGSVYHWWHPLTEQGLATKMTDDLLWLAFVVASYIKETGDVSILDDTAPFLDDSHAASLLDHVDRAFARVFRRSSRRMLPLIGAGDWNDGLSAVGLRERGESVWLGHFLTGLLCDWAEIHALCGRADRAFALRQRRTWLVDALNGHAWDGNWYLRATLDSGLPLGSATCKSGKIYLNAQIWAILNDVAPPERAAACIAAVREHLVSDAGALLLAPAYDTPAHEIGYITRYAPGMRENGGVYTHAATWAIAAAAKMKDAELVDRLLTAINPALKDPDRYWAEPYVLPGNVDGPASPHHGRGGWTWYTGSAAWLHRVVTQWVLGVRPEWDGLHLDPCLPPGWDHASMVRPYRGGVYRVTIERKPRRRTEPGAEVTFDGKSLEGSVIPLAAASPGEHEVEVTVTATAESR